MRCLVGEVRGCFVCVKEDTGCCSDSIYKCSKVIMRRKLTMFKEGLIYCYILFFVKETDVFTLTSQSLLRVCCKVVTLHLSQFVDLIPYTTEAVDSIQF